MPRLSLFIHTKTHEIWNRLWNKGEQKNQAKLRIFARVPHIPPSTAFWMLSTCCFAFVLSHIPNIAVRIYVLNTKKKMVDVEVNMRWPRDHYSFGFWRSTMLGEGYYSCERYFFVFVRWAVSVILSSCISRTLITEFNEWVRLNII